MRAIYRFVMFVEMWADARLSSMQLGWVFNTFDTTLGGAVLVVCVVYTRAEIMRVFVWGGAEIVFARLFMSLGGRMRETG